MFALLPIGCMSEYLHGQGFGAILSCLSVERSNCFKSLKITAYLPVRSLTRTLFWCTCHRQYFVRASAHLWSSFRSNHVVEWKEKHRRQLIHLINKNALLDCTIVKFYIKELNDCLASIEDVIFGLTVSLFLIL